MHTDSCRHLFKNPSSNEILPPACIMYEFQIMEETPTTTTTAPTVPPPRPPPPECGYKRRKVKPKRSSMDSFKKAGSSDYYAELAAMAGKARKMQRSSAGKFVTTSGTTGSEGDEGVERVMSSPRKAKHLMRRSSSERVSGPFNNREVGVWQYPVSWPVLCSARMVTGRQQNVCKNTQICIT